MPRPPSKPKLNADTHPDAWQRFEKAVDIGLKTKPMHREASRPAKKAKRKKRA